MDNSKVEECYRKIAIEGIVQGVGFRPFVYKTAVEFGISGNVANKGGFVEIHAAGRQQNIEQFINVLKFSAPQNAVIENIIIEHINQFHAVGFNIIESTSADSLSSFAPPDLSVCDECKRELFDHKDRRHKHFFNSCVNCGPRFSIIERLPYDRKTTSMREFLFCNKCGIEYFSQNERRFHAETICCNECGPILSYICNDGIETDINAFGRAIEDLKRGQIVAVKGIGGYHYACSPFDNDAVLAIRNMKGRDSKPFAVMFKNIDVIKEICNISQAEEQLILSNIKPITLLDIKTNALADAVLMGNSQCGCLLPYTPLHSLLLDQFDALLMTSANVSGSAIIYDDDQMLDLYEGSSRKTFSGVLTNNRKIVRSVEDSVAQISNGQTQIIRRARGLTPSPFVLKNTPDKEFIAIGGDLKAAFCLVKNGYAYVSQYFGDLEDLTVFERFKTSVFDQMTLFNIKPKFVVCDMHPGYFSVKFSESLGLPVYKVQHHFAHAASVIAEHHIYEKSIAVCFDGTGYGTDGTVWGGEFLICESGEFKRAGHMNYVKLLGSDSAARDAKKTALSYMMNCGIDNLQQFDDRYNIIKTALDADINTFQSSAAGRLFDAISAILGICTENGYEGQCAVALQQCAESALKNNVTPLCLHFDIDCIDEIYILNPDSIINKAYKSGNHVCEFALGFHIAFAGAIVDVCNRISSETGIKTIVLSGGVFQNKLLMELTMIHLQNCHFNVYTNNMSPANDGGISLGQAYIGGYLCV